MQLEGRCTRPSRRRRRRIRQRNRRGPERNIAAQPTPGLQRPGEALHHGRQRRRLSRLSNRRAVLGRRLISIRAAGENACMEGGDGFLCDTLPQPETIGDHIPALWEEKGYEEEAEEHTLSIRFTRRAVDIPTTIGKRLGVFLHFEIRRLP